MYSVDHDPLTFPTTISELAMRVNLIQKSLFYLLLAMVLSVPTASATPPAEDKADTDSKVVSSKKLDWRLGATSYSFRLFSFSEAVDKTKTLGLGYIEAYEGQPIFKDLPETIERTLPDEAIQKIRRKLDEAGVKLTSIYIGSVPGEEAGCREVFEFAKKLGVETIISEPDPKDLDTIEKFCDEYEINLALHNHPKGTSLYWHPDEVLKACEGRGKRIGACADLGHWQRSGLKPVDGVRLLGKRILSMHVKDLNEFGVPEAHDVPWGTGQGELEATLREIHRLGLEPTIFGIEYEYHWENSTPEIAECVKFFQRVAEIFNQ